MVSQQRTTERAIAKRDRPGLHVVWQRHSLRVDADTPRGHKRHNRTQLLKRIHHLRHAIGTQYIVVIKGLEVLASRELITRREVAVKAQFWRVAEVANTGICRGRNRLLGKSVIGVIGDDNFNVAKGLGERAL